MLEFVGIVKVARLREVVTLPRLAWRCKCGWTNIYQPVEGI